jgi:uncharacterized membrane protein
MAEGGFSRARLGAFSDGAIAVIIAIMALDLKAPADDRLASLLEMRPSLLCYAISAPRPLQ